MVLSLLIYSLQRPSLDIVYDSNVEGNHYAYISDIALDKNGYPVIAFTTLEIGSDDEEEYSGSGMNYRNYARFNGEEWIVSTIVEAGGDILVEDRNSHPAYNGGLMLNYDNPSEVVLGREVNGFGSKEFEIELWKTEIKDFLSKKLLI